MTPGNAILLLVYIACVASAPAAERKAYKYVDEKGNVTYSQTPPENKDAKPVDLAPAHQGRGGYAASLPPVRSRTPYVDGRNQAMGDHQRRQEEARQEKTRQLKSECIRQRGTDCDNPEALRYMDSQSIPYRR